MTQQKLQSELNVVNVIKNLWNQKILQEASVLTKEVNDQIMHHRNNILDLEDTSDFDSNLSTEHAA